MKKSIDHFSWGFLVAEVEGRAKYPTDTYNNIRIYTTKKIQQHKIYVILYILLLSIVSFPSKYIFYLASPTLLFYTIFFKGFWGVKHILFILLIIIISLLSLILEPFVVPFTFVIWPLTYGTFLLIITYLLFPLPTNITCTTIRSVLQIATYWIGIQGIVGIAQYILSGNPDAVAGTVGLLDYLGNITINQVYFGFSVLSLVPAVLFSPYKLHLRWISLSVALFAVALSQSGHGTAAFLVVFIIVYIISNLKIKNVILGSIIIAAIISATLTFYPNTLNAAQIWYERTVNPNSPKVLMFNKLLFESSNDIKLLLLGSGPGQYISRAALIGSGLLTKYKSTFQETPKRTRESFVPILNYYYDVGEGSAITKPYNSFMSIYAEYGAIVTSGLLLVLIKIIIQNLFCTKSCSIELSFLTRYVAFFTLYLFTVSLVELYFEMPAAIAPGGWLAVIATARVKYLRHSSGGSVSC